MTGPSDRAVTLRGPSESSERVLIVDNDGHLDNETASALVSLGYAVSSIAAPSEALDVAHRFRPTLLIADIDVGVELGGLRLADAIRKRWGAAVIVLSPRTDLETVSAIAAAAPDAALYKPFYWRQLELTVRLAIATRRARPAPTVAAEANPGSDLTRANL